MPEVKPLLLLCGRCGSRFDVELDRASIYLVQGGVPTERLKNTKVKHLCGECAESLRAWLGIPPVEPIQLTRPLNPEWDE